MELSRVAWGFIVGLPTLILAVLLAAFPESAILLLILLVGLWIAMAFVWLVLRIRQLEAENNALRQPSQPGAEAEPVPLAMHEWTEPGWRLAEEIDLLLDGGWQPTKTFHFEAGASVKTTIAGNKRFIVHLATGVGKRTFRSVEASGETVKLTRIWRIKSSGEYAFVIRPVGHAPFHVLVKVEEAEKGGIIPP